MATTAAPLLRTQKGAVLTLTLNRPERLNSLTAELIDSLTEAFAIAAADDGVRCVILTGAGRGFCAGQDLTENIGELDVRRHLREHYLPLLMHMRRLEKPVVAAINGVAAGAGLSLALACDLRLAAEGAQLIQAFVRIGLVPDAGGTWFLPRLVGPAKAAELAMLGDAVDAAEAERIGLVNRVVPAEALEAETVRLAERLAAGPRAVGLIERALALSMESDLETQLGHEGDLQAEAAATADFIEGVTAFQEKRAPRFTGS